MSYTMVENVNVRDKIGVFFVVHDTVTNNKHEVRNCCNIVKMIFFMSIFKTICEKY